VASPGALVFTFELEGEVQVKRRFEGLLANTEDLAPALERIAEHFREHLWDVFESQGTATAGGMWKQLSPEYAAWKSRHYPGARILQQRRRLRASFTAKGAEGHVERIHGNTLEIGSDLERPADPERPLEPGQRPPLRDEERPHPRPADHRPAGAREDALGPDPARAPER
jgi:hypothetical protein